MPEVSFRSEVYGPEHPEQGVACFVVGLGDCLNDFDSGIDSVVSAGYRVVGYQYPTNVLSGGRPESLIELISAIKADFEKVTGEDNRRKFIGHSLGALITYNLHLEDKTSSSGIYVAAGPPLVEVIFGGSMLSVQKRFERNNFGEAELREAWQEIDISADKPLKRPKRLFVVQSNGDERVRPADSTAIFHAWEQADSLFKVLIKHSLSHEELILWANRHMLYLLNEVDKL